MPNAVEWGSRSDGDLREAVRDISAYRNDVQEAIYREAKKRGLLGVTGESLTLDQVHWRIAGNELQVATEDIADASGLRSRMLFGPRVLTALAIVQLLFGLTEWVNNFDSAIDIPLGVFAAYLAVATRKSAPRASTVGFVVFLIMTFLWGLMFVGGMIDDLWPDSAKPMVLGLLSLGALSGLRANKRYHELYPGRGAASSHLPLQGKYFHTFKRPAAVGLVLAAIASAVVGLLLVITPAIVRQIGTAAPTPFWVTSLAGAAMLVGVTPFFWRQARSVATLSAPELRATDARERVLYLRSFGDDDIRLTTALQRTLGFLLPFTRFFVRDVTFEESVAGAAAVYGPVVAISDPEQTGRPLGAAREHPISAADWKQAVTQRVEEAVAVLAVLGKTTGLAWEIQNIRALGLLEKLILIVPPVGTDELMTRWEALSHSLPELGRVPFQMLFDSALIVLFPREATPVLITGPAREQSDYFEAIQRAMLRIDNPS